MVRSGGCKSIASRWGLSCVDQGQLAHISVEFHPESWHEQANDWVSEM